MGVPPPPYYYARLLLFYYCWGPPLTASKLYYLKVFVGDEGATFLGV